MAIAPTPTRGEIWLVDFDPAVGGEIRKVRPALVVSLDAIGGLPLRLVVPITDWKPQYVNYPWLVKLQSGASTGLIKDSGADAFQTKSVSSSSYSAFGKGHSGRSRSRGVCDSTCVGAVISYAREPRCLRSIVLWPRFL